MDDFLEDLEDRLEDMDISSEQIIDILNDYKEFYEEYLTNGYNKTEILEKLGNPKDIVNSLKASFKLENNDTYKSYKYNNKSKIVGILPFIITITYILIGYFANIWHPTWLLFLLIPLSAVILNGDNFFNSLINMSPFICTAIFLIVGFYTGYWHPTWLIYFLIPLLGIFKYKKDPLKKLSQSLVFIGVALSILLTYFNIISWSYAWLFMLLFVIVSLINSIVKKDKTFKNSLLLLSILIACISYIIMIYYNIKVPLALLVFILPFITSVWANYIQINFIKVDSNIKKSVIVISFLIAITLFIVLGITFNSFGYIWQILLIPIMITTFILPNKNEARFTSIMPFISIIIFYSLGYFYGLWAISWLAFLLIPIVGVLEGNQSNIKDE